MGGQIVWCSAYITAEWLITRDVSLTHRQLLALFSLSFCLSPHWIIILNTEPGTNTYSPMPTGSQEEKEVSEFLHVTVERCTHCRYFLTHMCKNIWQPEWPAVCRAREERETERGGRSMQSGSICSCASVPPDSSGTSKEADVFHTVTSAMPRQKASTCRNHYSVLYIILYNILYCI